MCLNFVIIYLKALEDAQQESQLLKGEVEKLKTKADQCTGLKAQLEKQTFELQQVTSKLKEIEYEKDSYKDWQQQAKVRSLDYLILSKTAFSFCNI